jgi:hypothetical protein
MSQIQKSVLGSSLGEDVRFRGNNDDDNNNNNNNNNNFYDIQRYVSNYWACGKLPGNND